MIRLIFLGLFSITASGLLFVNLYNSIVDAPNWGADLPNSLVAARQYFSAQNPGDFFRVFSPLNQVLALIAVIACWKLGKGRYLALGALAFAVLADVFTFGYFYPRNEIMFIASLDAGADVARQAWEQWSTMNWLRSSICANTAILALMLLTFSSKKSAA